MIFLKQETSLSQKLRLEFLYDGTFPVSSLLSVVISNSKQVDTMNAVTKWRMVLPTILKLQQYRLELLNRLLIIIYAMNV